jgi:hypothetical protein
MPSSGGNYYHFVPAKRRGSTVDDVARGMQVGQSIGKLIGGVAGAVKSSQQDAAANALMNQQSTADANAQAQADPDPDPLPDGTDNLNPTAATDPSGTQDPTPFTGGVAGMKLQQQFQKSQLADQIQQASLADKLAQAAGTGRFAKRATPAPQGVQVSGQTSLWNQPGGNAITPPPTTGQTGQTGQTKPQKYVAGSGDYENDESTDDASQIKADFEALHGAGTFHKFANSAQVDANGNYIIPGKGSGGTDANGQPLPPPPELTIPKGEGDIYTQRINAYKRKSGLPFTVNLGGAGTQDNPLPMTTKLQVRSLPQGTWVVDPVTKQKYMIGVKGS